MGSKKTKKKKIKCKKRFKNCKTKVLVRENDVILNPANHSPLEKFSNEINISRKILSNKVKNPRFDSENKKIWKLDDFAQMREKCFAYLQTVVSENCSFCQNKPSMTVLEALSLQLEQGPLLASLQAEIYIKEISKIVKDIEKCTKEKQIHQEVKKLISKTKKNIISSDKNIPSINSSHQEIYSAIPIPINSNSNDVRAVTEEPLEHCNNIVPQHHGYSDDLLVHQDSVHCNYSESNLSCQNGVQCPVENSSQQDQCDDNKISQKFHSGSLNGLNDSVSQFNGLSSQRVLGESSETLNDHNDSDSIVPNVSNKLNPLAQSLSQLQKSVEKTLNSSEKISKEKAEEKERAYIAQILEGDDSFDENLNFISDGENEAKENVNDENFLNRIEKMREMFGLEEDRETANKSVLWPQKTKPNQFAAQRIRRPSVWKHEKVIQQYKYAMLASEMSLVRQMMNKKLFLELFGEDSDEEREPQYASEEKYRTSCTERISSWVVKHLMPYYNERRIVGRNTFKSLGHYISDAIVDEIQYPDEWTVKYFVSKFFPAKKRYVTDADILSFELD